MASLLQWRQPCDAWRAVWWLEIIGSFCRKDAVIACLVLVAMAGSVCGYGLALHEPNIQPHGHSRVLGDTCRILASELLSWTDSDCRTLPWAEPLIEATVSL